MEPSAITLDLTPKAFIFTVESTGCMSPDTLVNEAVKILLKKLETFSKKIEKDDVHDDIESFNVEQEQGRRLYSVGGDVDEKEEDIEE